MKTRILTSLLAAAALSAFVAPAAIAADLTDIGYVDQSALGSLPQFVQANQQLAQFKASMDQQFASAMKAAKNDADRQAISLRFQQQYSDKQRELIGPLFQRTQLALATVAGTKKLSIVVDRRIIVYGGQDITNDVISQVRSSNALVPPQATPPPSEIGFVDESALEGSQKVKDASDQLQKFQDDQRAAFEAKIKAAKTDVEKTQIATDFQKVMTDKRDALMKPLLKETTDATASVARSKNLLLVIDRADVVFGGTDITADVQNALK